MFQGKEIVTINVEITKDLYKQILQAHKDEIDTGQVSLTPEQYVGGLLQIGYNWVIYKNLKKVFEK
jgi:hypothetical protein